MTGIRRSLLTATLTVGMFVGALLATVPAQASFADSVPVATTTFATATVAAPTNVVGSLACGSPNATMNVTWTASATPRISGYVITVYFSDGYTQATTVAGTATSWSAPITAYNVTAYQIQYSVMTQTDYGWTKESPKTGWFHC
jgi:hypothetical protein